MQPHIAESLQQVCTRADDLRCRILQPLLIFECRTTSHNGQAIKIVGVLYLQHLRNNVALCKPET